MTASTVTTLYDFAIELLTACDTALATTEAGAPAAAFVSPGPPVFETTCDQLAVYCGLLGEEETSPLNPPPQTGHRYKQGSVILCTLQASIVRCADVMKGNALPYQPLDATELTLQAKAVYEDGWAMWNYIEQQMAAGALFEGSCRELHLDNGVPIAPEGGLNGWTFTLRAAIDGYQP